MTVEQLKKPIRFIGQIIHSPGFYDAEAKTDATLETSFARAAFNLLEAPESAQWSHLDECAVNVMATLPRAIEAQQWLGDVTQRTEKDLSLTAAEREGWIREMLPFNEALKALLASNPAVTVDYIIDLAESVTTQLYPEPEMADYVIRFTKRRAEGMLHEVIAEQVIHSIEGVSAVYSSSHDDEILGVDIIVLYKGSIIRLDIKATSTSVKKAQKRGYELGNITPVWTGLKTVDLNGSSNLTDEMRATVRSQLEEALQNEIRYERTS